LELSFLVEWQKLDQFWLLKIGPFLLSDRFVFGTIFFGRVAKIGPILAARASEA
jgi:hypothetical protein